MRERDTGTAGSRNPRVVILGSPNVGKSTLFNRLLGRRRTITDATPGVTRDFIGSACSIKDIQFDLIDTGGFQSGREGQLESIISERSLEVGREASLILLVVDVNRINGDDEAFIERLRPFSEKLMLVVNKVDNPAQDNLVWNMLSLGFDSVIGVSAAHGRNILKLKQEIHSFLQGSGVTGQAPPKATIRVAIMGKPNTGKSTLSNRLLGEERSLVSEEPGTTRDVIEGQFTYSKSNFKILDTAGIRRKNKVKDTLEYFSVAQAIHWIKACDLVYLLIDAGNGLSEQDKKIAALVMKEGKGIILVLNKWDLLNEIPNRLQAMRDRISFVFPVLSFAPILPVSALTGLGIDKMLRVSLQIKQQLEKRVGTSELNQRLEQWVIEYPPPVRGKNVKIRYATQISSNPLRFVFFVNKPLSIPGTYRHYIANRIRGSLGFDLVPLSVEFRQN